MATTKTKAAGLTITLKKSLIGCKEKQIATAIRDDEIIFIFFLRLIKASPQAIMNMNNTNRFSIIDNK